MTIPELRLLQEFQDRAGYGGYSECFGLDDFNDTSGLSSGWSEDPEFLSRLIPFATATGGGSFYAFWRADDREDLATLPVVVFGDEGGEHVVAGDLRGLLRLLTFDTEPCVDHGQVFFYRLEDEEHSDSHEEFVAWLGTHFGLAAVDDPEEIIDAAQAEWGERFATWKAEYLEQKPLDQQ
ncbi:hypothetical protein [Actinoplanes derwentensis]|uniref:hypothetical protein n=1 Tax=Actinoplanes derwentensis TaxID=113562 RepID=UPI0018D474CD|nr:hypothetical protein [Actinoplanes derwentensis]GID90024.1 hypothetical protein Ade03nite_89480 [Actinoplanes derwentensis]